MVRIETLMWVMVVLLVLKWLFIGMRPRTFYRDSDAVWNGLVDVVIVTGCVMWVV